jgi:hypothetical protein
VLVHPLRTGRQELGQQLGRLAHRLGGCLS